MCVCVCLCIYIYIPTHWVFHNLNPLVDTYTWACSGAAELYCCFSLLLWCESFARARQSCFLEWPPRMHHWGLKFFSSKPLSAFSHFCSMGAWNTCAARGAQQPFRGATEMSAWAKLRHVVQPSTCCLCTRVRPACRYCPWWEDLYQGNEHTLQSRMYCPFWGYTLGWRVGPGACVCSQSNY